MEANGLPSRTSILTAAARAFGSREPDASVRNPDWLADRLIGPAELALITEHPISKSLDLDFAEASHDPDVFGFAWMMLVRTRFIDELLERAVRNGTTQVVILGAGFDSRAHRFADLLKDRRVIEIDYHSTQEYKKQRVEATLGASPGNVTYAPIDFTVDNLADVLRRSGHRPGEKTFYICEGVSMYVPEDGMCETLRTVANHSAAGSTMALEYVNRSLIEFTKQYPMGVTKTASDWGEPFVFGVPDGQDREFFLENGLELGEALKMGSPESVQRYAMRQDGTYYGAHLAKVFQERREAALKTVDEATRQQAAQQMAQSSSSGYWLAELIVPERAS